MDSVTQITLGAAIGEATLGRRAGYRAALWGGICGTLPDLDSFIPYGDAVATVTYHRSFSHSLLVLPFLTPLLVRIILKFHPELSTLKREWFLLVFLVLFTHPLLDGFTVYGTQLLWPVYIYPVSWSTIFIIDPAYTLPLLCGLVSARLLKANRHLGFCLNIGGIVLSSLYLTWTVAAKLYVNERVSEQLNQVNNRFDRVLTTPAPFNTLVWRIVAMVPDGYYEGFYSIFNDDRGLNLRRFDSEPTMLQGLESHWPVQRLQWFTHGFYRVSRVGTAIIMTDLRMGQEPAYVFNYKIGEVTQSGAVPNPGVLMPGLSIWQRFQDQTEQ